MEGKEAYASWLLNTKKFVGKSKEWKGFVGELREAVGHHLAENHVPSFDDLSQSERLLFIDRASKTVQSGSAYDDLYSQVSLTLDQQVNNSVAKELLTNTETVDTTKTELILDHLRDGAVSILKRWPEMKSKLHMCLNMPLPHKIQSVAWTFFMSDPQARKVYLSQLMSQPKRAISRHDQTITETCENILKIQNTFPDIGPPSVGPFFAMKAVLSYFHSQMKSDEELHHVYYLLILPMLHVLNKYLSKTHPAANNIVAVLVEMYQTFIRDLPKYIADIKGEHKHQRKLFSDRVAEHLINYDREQGDDMSQFIANLSFRGNDKEKSQVLTTDTTVLTSMLSEVLLEVISPLIMSMFVGFLNTDVLMYVWDQYVIGLDVAGYHMHFLPAFTATLFILLREDILKCRNVEEMIAVVQRESPKINIRMVQNKMKLLYYKMLYSELNEDDKVAVPAIDPTKVTDRSWVHWNNDIVPQRTGVQQRQLARDTRLAERERLIRLRRDEEIRLRLELADRQRLAEQRLLEDADRHRLMKDEERLRLQRLYDEERRGREGREIYYETELARLRREIEELKLLRPLPMPAPMPAPIPAPIHVPVAAQYVQERPASIRSYASVRAPPPSRMSIIPSLREQPVAPVPIRAAANITDPTASQILLDIISTVANRYKKLAHGAGAEANDLNRITKGYLNEHEEDVEQAQLEVFGRKLKPGEFDGLPDTEKAERGNEVMDAVVARVEERWSQQVKIKNAQKTPQ